MKKILVLFNFKGNFEILKKQLEKDRKEIFFHKKTVQEETEYFNFMKFIFNSPDKSTTR